MIPTLSKGAVEQIIRDPDNLPQNPILQVLGIKKIASSSGNDRYRFVLSDGIHLHTAAMLATQLNDKIANKEIDVKAIVKLDKYICNTLQETRKVLIILGVTVLADGGSVPGKIGDPQQLGQNNNSAPAPKPAFGQAVASDQNGHAKEPPKQFNAPPQRQQQFTSPAKPAGGSSFGQRNSAFGSTPVQKKHVMQLEERLRELEKKIAKGNSDKVPTKIEPKKENKDTMKLKRKPLTALENSPDCVITRVSPAKKAKMEQSKPVVNEDWRSKINPYLQQIHESELLSVINSGDLKQLKVLHTIGDKRARLIIEFRNNAGPFNKLSDLTQVDGISDKVLATFLRNNLLPKIIFT